MKKFFNIFLIFIAVGFLLSQLIGLINSRTAGPDFIDDYSEHFNEQTSDARENFQKARELWEEIKEESTNDSQQQNDNQNTNANQNTSDNSQSSNDNKSQNDIWRPKDTQIIRDDEQDHTDPASVSSVYFDYHILLDDEEKELYLALWEGLKQGKTTITTTAAPHLTQSEAYEVAESVVFDHPEYFWLSFHLRAHKNGNKTTIHYTPYEYWNLTVDPAVYTDSFYSKVKALTAETIAQGSDDAKIQYIHDYLVRTVSYDHPSMDESPDYMLYNKNSRYAFTGTAYGAIMNSSAICAGYAKAFQIVLQNAGFTTGYLTGDAGGAHAWNRMYRNNQILYYDVTFDDRGDDYAYPNDLTYTFYGKTKSEMDRTHTEN